MKPILNIIKWLALILVFSQPIYFSLSYITSFSKLKWIAFIVQTPSNELWIFPVTTFISGAILISYCIWRLINVALIKSDRTTQDAIDSIRYKRQQELRDYVMKGGLSESKNYNGLKNWYESNMFDRQKK